MQKHWVSENYTQLNWSMREYSQLLTYYGSTYNFATLWWHESNMLSVETVLFWILTFPQLVICWVVAGGNSSQSALRLPGEKPVFYSVTVWLN
jgi:hypothetical protein